MLFEQATTEDADQGDWHVFATDKDTGRVLLRYKVRRVPSEERRRLARQFPVERDAIKLNCAVGAYALVDSDGGEQMPDETAPRPGYEFRALDKEASRLYTVAAGFPVPIGETICLDGRWTAALKVQALKDRPKTCDWINRVAWSLEEEGEKAEAKKD